MLVLLLVLVLENSAYLAVRSAFTFGVRRSGEMLVGEASRFCFCHA